VPILRFTVEHDYPLLGGPGVNVFHYRTAVDTVDASEIALAADALQDFYSAAPARLHEDSTFTLREQVLDVQTSEVFAAVPWSVSGTATGAYLPPSNQVCINWTTGNASRSGRGRTFMGPLPFSSNLDSDGTPSPTLLAAAATWGNVIVSFNAQSGNGAFVVWSSTQQLGRDITGSNGRDQFAVLRSRRD
jgi:hypothetical protein